MYRFDNRIHFSDRRSSLSSAILLLLVVLGGFMIIGPLVGMMFAIPFIEGSFMDLAEKFTPPFNDPSARTPLFIMQGFASAIGLILIPILFFRIREGQPLRQFFKRPVNLLLATGLVFLIGFCFMGVNAYFIEWNQGISFPDFMRGFEDWARKTEQNAADATKFLTTFDSFAQFLLAFVVIAIIPAFGEELVFRGLLQNYFHRTFINIHVAIWLSAILFSAIHVQFFGFVPRMLLGALFGYLYYWSANLWIPIIAHFFNNAFTILMVYLHQRGIVDFDLENTEAPPWYTILLFGALTFLLLRYFYTFFKKHYTAHDQMEERVQDERQD